MAHSIQTDRLLIRNFKASAIKDYYEYASIPGLGEQAGWVHHESIEESKEVLKGLIKRDDVFAIVLKSENKVIGSISISPRSYDDNLPSSLKQRSLGYLLSTKYWHHGYASEAIKAITHYAFEYLKCDILWASSLADNLRS